MQTHRPTITANTAAEVAAVALLAGFWIWVWLPGLLPTAAVALLAWSRAHPPTRSRP